MKTMIYNFKYLLIGILSMGLTACANDSDEPNPVVKDEISRSTITVERTVTLTTPGTLQDELKKIIDDVSTLQKLTLSGPYNGWDVEYWKTALVNLIEFDLKDAVPTYTDVNTVIDEWGNECRQYDNEIMVNSFYAMTSLEKIVFPSCVTNICRFACKDCTNLAEVLFPANLNSIEEYVFDNSGLTSIEIPSSVTYLSYAVFRGNTRLKNATILANISSIPSCLFERCSALETVKIPSSVFEVGDMAFEGCTSLKSFPFSQITKINGSSFHQSGIEEADLSNVTDFSNATWCFRLCESLKKVILPDNVTSLANTMFWGCTNLTEVNIPTSLETLNDQVFGACGLKEVVIPSSVKHIGSEAFYANYSLEKVTLPVGLETIGYQAFRETAITEITIPNTVTYLDNYAFCGTKITEVEIPSSVTYIGHGAFESTQLKELTIPSTVTSVGGSLFDHTSTLCAIFWESQAEVRDPYGLNPNCYLYLANDHISCGPNWKNVVVNINGEYVAESVILCEGGQRENSSMSYSVPKGFTAKKITYERYFEDWWGYWTYPGECSGWQTIVLPFTPTKIECEDKGEIAPFNSGIEGAKPFWLRELTAEGWKDRTTMESNKAYIIAMPNHDSYMEEYRLYGKITFSAEDVELEATIDETTQTEKVYPASVGPEYDLQPTYQFVGHGPLVYALNTNYGIDGHQYGSVFARSSSDVYAFEAYVYPGGRLARSAFGIDTSSSNTRSAKEKNTTGIPQIGDM